MTTREISSRIDKTPRRTTDKLCKMLRVGLVEKVEGWGWKITRDGINCLIITNSNNNNNYAAGMQQNVSRNAAGMQQKCSSSFPLENKQQEKEEWIPGCFHMKWCHIKKFSRDKTYNNKTNIHCDGCVWFKSTAWTGTNVSNRNVG